MKKILVVFTGGTIGSSLLEHTIDTAGENRFRLLARYQDQASRVSDVHFVHIAPIQMLSENMHPRVWEQLLIAIDNALDDTLDGIIVTHGTDTLAFTASLLSVYYQHVLKIPLVLVSSDFPLSDPRANGLANFSAAVEFMRQRTESGVFVAYQNYQQVMHIHQGYKLASCLQLSSDFISVQTSPYLEYKDNRFIPLTAAAVPVLANSELWPLHPRCTYNLILLKPYPGLNYAHINLEGVDVVLHELYHSGTACVDATVGQEYSLLNFSQRCQKLGVDLFLAPAIKCEDLYASTQSLVAHGAQFIWDTSLETAYVQLLLAYGNFKDAEVRNRFLQPLFK